MPTHACPQQQQPHEEAGRCSTGLAYLLVSMTWPTLQSLILEHHDNDGDIVGVQAACASSGATCWLHTPGLSVGSCRGA